MFFSRFLGILIQKGVHFGTLFFEIGPGIPKRAPSEKRWAPVGSPGRPWRRKKSFWEGSESDPEMHPKKYPELRALGRSKTRFGDIRMASARFECIRKKHRKGAKNYLQNGLGFRSKTLLFASLVPGLTPRRPGTLKIAPF